MKTINDVPIILRREIEALMIAPFIDEFAKEIGEEKTIEIVRKVVAQLALKSGQGVRIIPKSLFGCFRIGFPDATEIRMKIRGLYTFYLTILTNL